MITNKFSVFSKKQNTLLGIINVIQIVIGILSIIIALVSSVPEWNGKLDYSYGIALFIGIMGSVGLIEIFVKTISHRKTFAYSLLLKIYRKNAFLYSPTQIQSEICSWANKSIQSGKSILLYGQENSGKTTSIFIYLSQYIKNKEIIKNLAWVENILYIDCKSNKSDILDFFDSENPFFRNHEYEKCLIIIDNIEAMGEVFFNRLLRVIKDSISTFILLADVCNIDALKYDVVESKEIEKKFSIKIYKKHVNNFKKIFTCLSAQDKKILLTIYYISMSVTLISLQDVYAIWDVELSRYKIRRSLKTLVHYEMIKEFPFDNNYILLVNQKAILENQNIFWETPENTDVIMRIIKNSCSFPESAWLSFIHLPYENQIQLSQSERDELFFKALKCSNYLMLSKSLNAELVYSPNKESLFCYEMGTLYFYNSQQEKAFQKYNSLLKRVSGSNQELPILLKIIETTHGNIDPITKKNINNYIEKLYDKGEPYSLYAQYWNLHIESERGILKLSAYNQLLDELRKLKINYPADIHFEIIKRSYTDLIRIYHMLFEVPPKKDVDDFLAFLKEHFDKATWQYYYALYIKANSEHYVHLLDKILNGESCESTYYQAVSDYETAIKVGYQNLKSVSACELKYIDLKIFAPQNSKDLREYEEKIKKFLFNAEINHVSVHIAYCKTLLAKLHIITNLTNEDFYLETNETKKNRNSYIDACISEAKKIYRDFENNYGIVRLEFLEFLYTIATCTENITRELAIKKITGILKKYPEYRRENRILDSIKMNNDLCNRMFIISLIKSYPIIMQ